MTEEMWNVERWSLLHLVWKGGSGIVCMVGMESVSCVLVLKAL